MVKMLKEIRDGGSSWEPKAVEVPAVLVSKDNIDTFLSEHPDAIK